MADHIVTRYIAVRYMTGYENVTAGSTVSSASTSISITGADSSGTDRIILAASSGAIDATGFQGSTSWSSDDADVTGEALFAWANTDTGVGGGLSIGAGTLASAGSSGTFTSTWASATKQANFSLSLVGTQLVELYDQTTDTGTDNVTCTAPTYGGGFYLLLFVQSVGNEEIATPSGGWVKVFSIGEGTGSGSTRITLFTVDADTVTDDTPTLTYEAASTTELPARPPVYPTPTHRKPNLALAVASCVVPFVASIGDLESPLSWQPEYPDRIEPRRGGLNTGGSFAPAPDPIPDAPAPDFSWVPKYPDRTERAYKRPIEGGCFRPTDAITAYYSDSTTGGGTTGTADRTVTITPAVGDLVLAFCSLSANTNTAMTATDDQGGTYYRVGTALWGTSANIGAVFVRNSLATTASAHVITIASGSNTAGALVALTAKGMKRAGANAVRSFGSQADQASGTAAPVLNQAALFSNMTLVALASGDTTTTPPSDWTERLDTNQASPTTAIEVSTRDFGFEGTTATFGASTSTTFASFILELDGSPLPAGDWFPSYPELARGHRPRPHGGSFVTLDAPAPVPELSWSPEYPDRCQPPLRNPFGGYADPAYTDLPERLTWRPSYPDRAPGHIPRPHGGAAWTPSDELDVPRLSWSPTYPDRAPGHRPRPHGGIVQSPQDTTTQPLCWRPEWPDFARGHLPRPRGGVVEALQDDDATPLSWSPLYPSELRRKVERLPGLSVLATDQVPAEETPVEYWWPSYPDRIEPQQTRPAPSVVAPLEAVTGPTLNAWQPEYPDRVSRRLTAVESAIVQLFEAATGTTVPDFWQPSYPAWFAARSRHAVHVGPFFIELEWDRATRYGWHPTYPDRVDRKQPTLTRGYTLTIVPQDDESPELAWQPTYPDWFPPARLSYGDHWGTFHWLLATEEFVSVDVRTPTTAPFTPTRSIASLTETQSRCSNEGSSTLAQTATRSIASLTVSESRVDNMSYEIKTGDTSPTIRATLKDQDEAAVNITGATVTFRWRLKGASSWTTGSASIVSGADGTVSYQWTSGQTDTAGTYESEWKVTASGNTRTFPSNEYSLFYIRP